jgi:sterol desaturase/sphingolipid hydroxylase (fatty acid hydroxylase superfamily)
VKDLIGWLQIAPWYLALAVLLLENVAVFLIFWGWGAWMVRQFPHRRVAHQPPPLAHAELLIAGSNVLLNTLVTLLGWLLWRIEYVRFRTDWGFWAALDVAILLLVMDLAMYGLHRLAHSRWFYRWLHRLHHVYDRPRPLTLFVLNPAENIAFGLLWLAVISAWSFSWAGMSVYLLLNVLFGTIGHLGVEPLPDSWLRWPVLRWVAGGSFHAQHHQDIHHNYGFYTLIWDRLFGTIRPDYGDVFGHIPGWASVDVPQRED